MNERFQETHEIARESLAAMTQGDDFDGVKTGLPLLDSEFGGFRKGDLTIIGGMRGMGLTSFGLTMVRNICIRNHQPCLYITVDEGDCQIMKKLIRMMSEVPPKNIIPETFTEEEAAKMQKAVDSICGAPLAIEYMPYCSVRDIRDKARGYITKGILEDYKAKGEPEEYTRTEGLSLIIIDGFDLSRGDPEGYSERYKIALELKRFAQDVNCPILLFTTVGSRCQDREDHLPRLSDLDKGAVAYADQVFFLHREEYYNHEYRPPEKASLIIEKCRYSYKVHMGLYFKRGYGAYTDTWPRKEAS